MGFALYNGVSQGAVEVSLIDYKTYLYSNNVIAGKYTAVLSAGIYFIGGTNGVAVSVAIAETNLPCSLSRLPAYPGPANQRNGDKLGRPGRRGQLGADESDRCEGSRGRVGP